MDTQQMFQELDRLYAQGKLDEAEEKMMGWMKEGLDSGNKSLCLMMCNEMEGLYRNTGRVAQAVDIPIIGMGGIATAEDAIEFLLAGATAVSVGTANFFNPAATIEVAEGIKQYMKQYGFARVEDMVGIVK